MYLVMFQNESGDEETPLFMIKKIPTDLNKLITKVKEYIGDDYDSDEDYIYGEYRIISLYCVDEVEIFE